MSDAKKSDAKKVATSVINLDADDHNANWLRLLAKRNQQQGQNQQHDKEHQSNG